MAGGQRTNQILVPQARKAMDQFKWETAKQVGINLSPGDYGGDIPSRLWGAVGGHMVRQMIQSYQQSLVGAQGMGTQGMGAQGQVQATTTPQPSQYQTNQ
ncbi:MAG: Small acid-soluble spore protein alpha/beta type [Clostridia bacterium 41_269]|nr:MAG: Small acid-soluble spore protein alpha/beta type [Clostridia bacterium 41_269]